MQELSESWRVFWVASQSRLEATETALTAANEAITELTAEKVGRPVWLTACLYRVTGCILPCFHQAALQQRLAASEGRLTRAEGRATAAEGRIADLTREKV